MHRQLKLINSYLIKSTNPFKKSFSNIKMEETIPFTEDSVGISGYINPELPGFQGIQKQRYSDFIVREVTLDGNVVMLMNTSGKELENKHFQKKVENVVDNVVSTEDIADNVSNELFSLASKTSVDGVVISNSEELKLFIIKCIDKIEDCPNDFISYPCPEKAVRGSMHQFIRSKVSKYTDSDTVQVDGIQHIRLIAKHKTKGTTVNNFHNRNKGKAIWPEGVGDFLRFTMLKENVDTISACGIISKSLRIKTDGVGFSGTKDKRAVTAQKCTVYRRLPSEFERLNKFSYSPIIRYGDFEYVNEHTRLGDLKGNHFSLVLRNVNEDDETIHKACNSVLKCGFLNYFGLQRFGKGGARSHDIGKSIFKSDWKKVCEQLFYHREGDRDDFKQAKNYFFEKEYKKAFDLVPQKCFTERTVLEGLIKQPNDFYAAYMKVSRNTSLLCAHAYQSYIWNMAVTERIRVYGYKCVVGDIVPVSNAELIDNIAMEDNDISFQNSEEIASKGDDFQSTRKLKEGDVRILTKADVESNKFTICDVILPLPGSDIILPDNIIGQFYIDLLSKDGLSLKVFKECSLTFRLLGAYRRMIQFPKDFKWSVVYYEDPNAELVSTEFTSMRSTYGKMGSSFSMSSTENSPGTTISMASGATTNESVITKENSNSTSIRAAVISFILPPGTYATMMLRELTKESTESQYQAQLTSIYSTVNKDDDIEPDTKKQKV
jgi:tRNA pseudouridine13 synthase